MVSASARNRKSSVAGRSGSRFRIRRITRSIWETVFHFPHQEAAITMPLSAATRRKPEMINSLAIMIIPYQAGSSRSSIIEMRAEETKSLSARGSMNFPKFVTR